MSKSEILAALALLQPDERREVRAELDQLAGFTPDEWPDDGELSAAEKPGALDVDAAARAAAAAITRAEAAIRSVGCDQPMDRDITLWRFDPHDGAAQPRELL